METKTSEYCLLYPVDSIEDFLKSEFKCSGNKLKKYFKKTFLNRSFNARSTLLLPLNFINDGEISPVYTGDPITIIDEDENFFVFSKNPNQFVHPLSYDESDNCLSFLRTIRPLLLKVNSTQYDRGLLYRLDYETSGVMIYVKDEELYRRLREEFSVVAKEKIYWCWVEGEMKESGVLKHSFSSAEEKGKRVVVGAIGVYPQLGELSVTPLEYRPDIKRTLVQVALKTGLRHQIRAQLAHIGHPLAGDTFYGGQPAQRLYLHALSYRLEVDGKDRKWESKPLSFNGL